MPEGLGSFSRLTSLSFTLWVVQPSPFTTPSQIKKRNSNESPPAGKDIPRTGGLTKYVGNEPQMSARTGRSQPTKDQTDTVNRPDHPSTATNPIGGARHGHGSQAEKESSRGKEHTVRTNPGLRQLARCLETGQSQQRGARDRWDDDRGNFLHSSASTGIRFKPNCETVLIAPPRLSESIFPNLTAPSARLVYLLC